MMRRLSGASRGIASSLSASQSMRFTASAQLWCSSSQCFHNAGASMNPLPQRQQVCGGCISGGTCSVAECCIRSTKCGGEGAFTCEAGVYVGFGIHHLTVSCYLMLTNRMFTSVLKAWMVKLSSFIYFQTFSWNPFSGWEGKKNRLGRGSGFPKIVQPLPEEGKGGLGGVGGLN